MRKLIFIFLFILFKTNVLAQVGGDYAYRFLNITSAPRQVALGGKNITNWDADVNQPFFNPASINPQMDNQVSLNFGKLPAGLIYGTAAYSKTFNNNKNFHTGINYINYGKFDGYDEFGMQTGSFTGSEIALSFGYSYQISVSDWYVGANAKFISSNMEIYSSFGAALDVGLLYVGQDNGLNFGFAVRNFGAQVSNYNDLREKIPLDVMIGVSKELENVPIRWHLTLDNLQKWKVSFSNPTHAKSNLDGIESAQEVGFFGNALRHVIIGVEFFPKRNFNLRLGYNFRRGEEMSIVERRHFSGLSAGVGLKVKRFKFDYSYSRHTTAANLSLFGLTVNLQ